MNIQTLEHGGLCHAYVSFGFTRNMHSTSIISQYSKSYWMPKQSLKCPTSIAAKDRQEDVRYTHTCIYIYMFRYR